MELYCDYHPTRAAGWTCPQCRSNFCSDCVLSGKDHHEGSGEILHSCPKCERKALHLPSQNGTVPFWQRLPKFFTYPIHPRTLMFIGLLALVSTFFSRPGLLSLLIRFVAWGVVLKYSFAVLKETARGKLLPPRINAESISEDFQVVFKQLGLYFIVGILFVKLTQTLGAFLGFLFLCFALLSIPAMIMVLVVTNSFLRAINPMVYGRMAWRIGWPYLLMYLFLILLGSAPAVLSKFSAAALPLGLQLVLMAMSKSYYTLISYHLMGYVIFQYHEKIGYEVAVTDFLLPERGDQGQEFSESSLLGRVEVLIKDGDMDRALSLIEEKTGGVIKGIALAERYYKLLKIKGLTSDLVAYGRRYLEVLARADQTERLQEVYSECIERESGFVIEPRTMLKVAGAFTASGNPRKAIEVYHRLIKAHPHSPLIPKVYFLVANLVNERLKNPARAAGILRSVIKAYPGHEIVAHAERYLAQIEAA